jgi:hypothetical protein
MSFKARMQSLAQQQVQSSSKNQLFILNHNSRDPSHLYKWRDAMNIHCTELYRGAANCLLTGEAYLPPEIPDPVERLTDVNDPHHRLRDQFREKLKARETLANRILEDSVAMFGTIMTYLSEESKSIIKRHIHKTLNEELAADYAMEIRAYEREVFNQQRAQAQQAEGQDAAEDAAAQLLNLANVAANPPVRPNPPVAFQIEVVWRNFLIEKDVVSLWQAIQQTHLTGRHEDVRLNKQEAQAQYIACRQGGKQSLESFKEKFDSCVQTLGIMQCHVPDQDSQVTDFIMRLDVARYGHMIADCKNHNTWPATVDDAFDRAYRWTNADSFETSDRSAAVFLSRADSAGRKKPNFKAKQSAATPAATKDSSQPASGAGAGASAPPAAAAQSNSTNNHNGKSNNQKGKKKSPPSGCPLCGEMHWMNKCPQIEYCKSIIADKSDTNLVVLAAPSRRLPEGAILLDTQASLHIFRDRDKLENVRPTSATYTIAGVNSTAAPLQIDQQGDYRDIGPVLYHPEAAANILSWSKLEDKFTIDYNQSEERITVGVPSNSIVFTKHNGHYMQCDDILVTTVADNMSGLTPREIDMAKLVKQTAERLAFPSQQYLEEAVRSGAMVNLPFTAVDVRNAYKLFGPDLASLKGKTTRPSPSSRDVEMLPPEIHVVRRGILNIDIMFDQGSPFLVGVLEQIDLTLITSIPNRSATTMLSGLMKFVNEAKKNNWVLAIRCDGEASVASIRDDLASHNVPLEQTTPGGHVPAVERKIRVIKERARGIRATLPFNLPKLIAKYLPQFVVSRLNLIRGRSSNVAAGDTRPPREQFYSRRIDFAKDVRVSFGEYCQVFNTGIVRSNSNEPRTSGAIALLPLGNAAGDVLFFLLGTRSLVRRSKWTSLPMPQEIVDMLNGMATASAEPAPPASDDDETSPPTPAQHTINNVPPPPSPAVAAEASTQLEQPADVDVAGVGDDDSAEGGDDDSAEADLPTTPHQSRDNQSTTVVTRLRDRSTLRPPERYDDCYHISVNKALLTLGQPALRAIALELKNILDYETIVPVDITSISDRRSIIRSSMFLKEKFLPSGALDKLKGRLVAGGNRQDKSIYSHEEISSPTVALWGVFITATIAAHEKRHVLVCDIRSAYLNAEVKNKILMRIEPKIAAIIVGAVSKFSPGLDFDGSLVVQLNKALYGCVESAALWYQHLKATLLACGYLCSSVDPCLFNKTFNGNKSTICVHVDDLLITSTSQPLLDELVAHLEAAYGQLTKKAGPEVDYLGMHFCFCDKVTVSMDGFVKEILAEMPPTSSAASPATSNLFAVRATSTQLDRTKSEKFHTMTAKLLYLSKRVRPDLLTAVGFLCTRVSKPDVDDLGKLQRLINYLESTKELKINFNCGDEPNLLAFVDASFGVHVDGKSHTGAVLTLGGGAILAKSSKQKIVTKSSTEAEIVGVSDFASQVIQVRSYLVEQKISSGPATIFQDNLSGMKMLEHGRPVSDSTRHINIRYFFVKDRVDNGEIKLSHLSTRSMISDLLTKPLQGALFVRHRNSLLNN